MCLKGHLSAITDLAYSNRGDRLLSASQKDGVVRIWSWNGNVLRPTQKKPSHILLQLSNPASLSQESTPQDSGRRPNRTSASTISCDVAVWGCDDKTILTSQSELEKQTGVSIIPGSQYIFLWDSYTGDCLLGLSNAHTMPCPVLISHPLDPTLICSAGADGFAKIWNVSQGECIFTHKNILDFGPIDARDRGNVCGFLDGAFSPDGIDLVLTDESGRVVVFDCRSDLDTTGEAAGGNTIWIREQYFANDYYDLLYDRNGYCVEQGSELPPHLSPRGVRCAHTGTPWSEAVDEMLPDLSGPMPVDRLASFWHRQTVRLKTHDIQESLSNTGPGNRIGRFDPDTTILVGKNIASANQGNDAIREQSEPLRSPDHSSNRMSSNYRWRDYSDMMQEEGVNDEEAEQDSDDEEFELGQSPARDQALAVDSDEDDLEDVVFLDSPERPSSSRRRTYIDDSSDSGSEIVEMMSTNNTPSGVFVADYHHHFFRISDSRSDSIERNWVRRVESNSSFSGRKSYTPQVGDSVVYIPRAHRDTISQFPSLEAPWQSWPSGAVWPVVTCIVRSIRFRFPFKAYCGRSTARYV